ncbi:hypothetical protein C3408_18680 [Candidatus Pantoea alvi]|uniref:MFS transporter n=1 Tax=Enterobacter agglomerans TaxID=549 RepID=UPI000CDDE66B|nr:MFS transporter [Pantoea agglomerans]POW55241.1 hypothetical protein C3408_18680 [Pantoea alvi]UBN52398.1 MFS transporter [Pantoea agglomerans]
MSVILFALSLCTFALGLAEFVAVSLVPAIAGSLDISVSSAGLMIGIYAIGVSIGAPVLSAALAGATRRHVLAGSMLIFAVSNLVTAWIPSLTALLISRLTAGLMHGVLLALAASSASAAVEPAFRGRAISTVFAGLTLALMLGVPLGTFAGSAFNWEYVFVAIAVIGLVGALLTELYTPSVSKDEQEQAPGTLSGTLLNRSILHRVLITAMGYAGSFTGFTYISVLLEQETQLTGKGISGMFFLFGVFAMIGNYFGGQLVDKAGSQRASLLVLAGIGIALCGAWLSADSVIVMACVMSIWGLASFSAVPVFQRTVLAAAEVDGSPDLASGMNIAGFNIGIAVGSALGGAASHTSASSPMLYGFIPLAAAVMLAFLLKPVSRKSVYKETASN